MYEVLFSNMWVGKLCTDQGADANDGQSMMAQALLVLYQMNQSVKYI